MLLSGVNNRECWSGNLTRWLTNREQASRTPTHSTGLPTGLPNVCKTPRGSIQTFPWCPQDRANIIPSHSKDPFQRIKPATALKCRVPAPSNYQRWEAIFDLTDRVSTPGHASIFERTHTRACTFNIIFQLKACLICVLKRQSLRSSNVECERQN